MTHGQTNKKGKIVFIFLIAILIPAIWFFFLNKDSDLKLASEKLTGDWLRADGPYTISLSNITKDGKMTAEYFNPGPIHVGKSEWRIKDDILQIYVELKDENYPGSLYQLTYDKKADVLYGTYYQAVAKETYEVGFNRK
jgi:hypothetical protein